MPLPEYQFDNIVVSIVPVPAAVWLFGSALAGLGWARHHSKRFRAMVLAAVVATSVGHTVAWAHGGGPDKGFSADRIERMTNRMSKKLDLSDEQRASIEAIVAASRAEAEPLQAELNGMREPIRAFATAETFDESALRARIEANAETVTDLMVIGVRTMHDVRAQLTPEQQAEAEAIMKKFGQKMHDRKDGRKSDRGKKYKQHRD